MDCNIYRITIFCFYSRENYSEFGSYGLESSSFARNRIRNPKLNSVAYDKLCSEVIWQTVEDFERLPNDIKLRTKFQDLTNSCGVSGGFTGYSDNSDSYSRELEDTLEDFFTTEKYSKYTGAVIKQYVNPNSPQYSSPNNAHKWEFHFSNLDSEVESVNHSPTSVGSAELSSMKKHNISLDYGGAKSKQRQKCDSPFDDRHHLSQKRNASKYEGESSVNRHKWKNMDTAISEEEGTSKSRWEQEDEVFSDSKAVTKVPTMCHKEAIIERRKVDSTADDKGKSELQNGAAHTPNIEHNTCSLETDFVMTVGSFKETSVDNKLRRGKNKESDSVKERLSQLNNRRVHENNLTIKHYFQMKSREHVAVFGSSEENVEAHESSTDDCVPGTPINTTQFGIQLISKTENLPVESPLSVIHCLREPKCSARIQQTESKSMYYDTDKSSSKAKISGYSKHSKRKTFSKLSTRRKKHKSAMDISKMASREIPSYFGSLMGKSDRESSLQNVYQQQLKTAMQTINEDEHLFCSSGEKSENRTVLSVDLLLCGNEQKGLTIVQDVPYKTSGNSKTNHGQEVMTNSDNTETIQKQVVTSSNNQDFRVSHLTLEQLEEKFKSNVKYLYSILKGEKYCWRHEQFQKGGPDSRNLCYAISTVPYTESQLDHILLLIRNTFYRNYSYMNHFDYIMKVLLPEATTKIFMDEFSLGHEETLQRIHNIYIVSDELDEKSLP